MDGHLTEVFDHCLLKRVDVHLFLRAGPYLGTLKGTETPPPLKYYHIIRNYHDRIQGFRCLKPPSPST
jgi:hypothetical protein